MVSKDPIRARIVPTQSSSLVLQQVEHKDREIAHIFNVLDVLSQDDVGSLVLVCLSIKRACSYRRLV